MIHPVAEFAGWIRWLTDFRSVSSAFSREAVSVQLEITRQESKTDGFDIFPAERGDSCGVAGTTRLALAVMRCVWRLTIFRNLAPDCSLKAAKSIRRLPVKSQGPFSFRLAASSWLAVLLVSAWPILCHAQLRFPNSLRNELDLTPIDASAREVVVLIHGWTAKASVAAEYNRYEDADEWYYLFNILKLKLADSGDKLVTYHWEQDASTGLVDMNPLNGALVQDAIRNATTAANRAVSHGTHLADLLHNQAPDLRRVHFIAHSAGAWAAREAAIHLLDLNPYVVIQITLCDPYIPGSVPPPWTPATTLVKDLMNDIISSRSDRIYRLENYYADDVITFLPNVSTLGTQETFLWRSNDINQQVDHGATGIPNLSLWYDFHSGPIVFYGDTVSASIVGNPVPLGLTTLNPSFVTLGWYRSLTAEAAFLPHITIHPQNQSAIPGQSVTLNTVATSSQALSYQWYRNGALIVGAEGAAYNFTASAGSPATYVVRVHNLNGSVFSEKAVVSVNAAVPILTFASPGTISPASTPQLISIYGANFLPSGDTNGSKLIFYDPANNPSPLRTPTYVNSGQLNYEATLPIAGEWSVKVVNGGVESLPYTFYVVSSGAQLTGLSINGPATLSENGNAQFSATAFFSDGSTQTVAPNWSENSNATSISGSGLLSAGSVNSDTVVTVSADYSSGGIAKSASANITVVNGGSGGGPQTTDVIVNGTFEAGRNPWGPAGYADVASLSYPHAGSWYGYVGNANNATGSISQFFPVPSSATAASLSFYLNIVTSETTATTQFDTLKVDLATGSDVYVDTIATFSNLDKGMNTNGSYTLRSYDIMSLLSAYKGQSLFLIFSGTTDSSNSTIFRIDDVKLEITTPTPVNLTGLSISGPSSVLEGSGETYLAKAIFSDGSTQTISPNSWVENSSVTTIDGTGFLFANQVSSDTPVTVTASYTFNGVTSQATKQVTVVDSNPPVTFTNLAINGPGALNENATAQFSAVAIFSDGSTQSVSPSWSENSAKTTISNSGLLNAGEVAGDVVVTITASYSLGGVTKSSTRDVLVMNSATPPTLASLDITGPGLVNENSTGLFTATATFSDGSTLVVVPTWGENSAATNISIFGLLSAGEVSGDTSVMVSASYTDNGITRSASKDVTVVNAASGGTLQFSAVAYPVSEGAGSVNLTVTRTGGSIGVVGVSYATANGTASSGEDYTSQSGTLSWADGETAAKTISIPLSNDSAIEGDETFTISLASPTGGAGLGSPAAATVTLQDDDAPNLDLPYEAKRAIATGVANGQTAANTQDGGLVIFGSFTGTITTGGQTLTSAGSSDFFAVKLDASGLVTWVKQYGGASEELVEACVQDPAGGWVISGTFTGTLPLGAAALTSAGDRDAFLARLDEDGNVLWARRAGGPSTDYGKKVAVDGAGNCFLAGVFITSATFSGGSTTLSASGSAFDLMIAKYSSDGVFQWAKSAGGSHYDDIYCAAADTDGNFYFGGIFEQQATYGPYTLTVGNPITGSTDAYLVKLGPAGDVAWAKSFGEPPGGYSNDTIDFVSIGADGSCFFGGGYNGPMTVEGQQLPAQSSGTAFVGKISPAGSLSWLRPIEATGTSDTFYLHTTFGERGLTLSDGGILVGGRYKGRIAFGTSIIPASTGNPTTDLYFARFDAAGTPLWAVAATNSGYDDYLLYLGSAANEQARFLAIIGGGATNLPNLGPVAVAEGKMLLVELGSPAVTIAPTITVPPISQSVGVGQSVTFAVVATGVPTVTYQWKKDGVNLAGATDATLTVGSVQANDAGSYTVVVTNSLGSVTSLPVTLAVVVPPTVQFVQQGSKLVGAGATGPNQGYSVAISADGNTAIVGGIGDDAGRGAAWIWTRSGGVWSQQGSKLVGAGDVGTHVYQGYSVAISADGNTAIVGGPGDNDGAGAVWVWTRSGGVWAQQGPKLVGSDAVQNLDSEKVSQGRSASISADGNTVIVGGIGDSSNTGAAWIWTRSGGVWTQQGPKLVGSVPAGIVFQGWSVSLSADGSTAIVGGAGNTNIDGGAWVWTRSGSVWTQQGAMLVGSGSVGLGGGINAVSVSLSADGNTAIVGEGTDNHNLGAAWIWTRSGSVWTQQGTKLVGSGTEGSIQQVYQGGAVSLSADGNTAIVGGLGDGGGVGGAWVWMRSGGVWAQQGSKLVGTGDAGGANQGASVSLSADGNTAIVGGYSDNGGAGAAWVFAVTPTVVAPVQTLFSDNFNDNSIDPSKWTASGNTVIEAGGTMQVLVNATDQTGVLESKPFSVNSRGNITISRRVKVHYGNEFAMPRFGILISGLGEFSVHYAQMSYSGGEAMARYGFFLARNGAWPHMVASQADVSEAIAAVWDTWFSEKLVYDPASGVLKYYIDDVLKSTLDVGVVPEAVSPTMSLYFTAWGWYTGHEQLFDDLVVSQEVVQPTISSALTASAQVGVAFSCAITARNSPSSFNATGLPPGLSIDTTTGIISGTPTALGTFPVSLGATNVAGTGTATLTLTVTAGFISWQQSKFTAGELADVNVSGPNAVYGLDGLPNLVKYALGLEPTQNITTELPAVSTTANDWVYTYTRPSDRTDITYEVEVSTDLSTWTTGGVIHEIVSSSGGTETWRARYPLTSAANVYFRLKVTQP